MSSVNSATPRKRILHPGDYAAEEAPAVLTTLLGSCVAVCLYDPQRPFIGMNHFLLATRRHNPDVPALESDAGRYGIHAMELLITALLAKGCARHRLRAKAFGGGNVLGHTSSDSRLLPTIGAVNAHFVRDFLAHDGIPLVAADMGGNFGRHIEFVSDDFSVSVRKIPSAQSAHLGNEERHYWGKVVEEQETTRHNTHFW